MTRKFETKSKFHLAMLVSSHSELMLLAKKARKAPGDVCGELIQAFSDGLYQVKKTYGLQFKHQYDSQIIHLLLLKMSQGFNFSEDFRDLMRRLEK